MANITVVGVGALGSHVVQFLRNTEGTIKVIDFDRVEAKNVLSQFHAKNTVGKSKVQSMQQSMKFLFGKSINAAPVKLNNLNARQLLEGSDLVIDCLDNIEGRNVVSWAVDIIGIPCLHGALAPNGMFGRVVWHENFEADAQGGEEVATCEDGEHLPYIGVVAAYLARSAQIFLESGKKLGFEISPTSVIST